MSAATAKYGILVGVDGSAQSNAAVAWAAREAVMRQLPITLLHIVAPVVVGWPVGQLYANMTEWQKDNAQQVIEQAREALTNSLGESKPPQVHTELVFEPPRHVRRLQFLERMGSCQVVHRGGTRRSCVSGRCGWSQRS
ncbi:universal stress protein, partial [Mycobacterium tuberculosis]